MKNKSKGNMYGFISDTWNPLHGECQYQCIYCSTQKFTTRYLKMKEYYSGPMRLHQKALDTSFKPNDVIFVCGQNDLFSDKVPINVVEKILHHCRKYPYTIFFFQTKNPEGFYEFIPILPQNSIFCVTLESNFQQNLSKAPSPAARMSSLYLNRDLLKHIPLHITIEPVAAFHSDTFFKRLRMLNPEQINIGGNTLASKKIKEPSREALIHFINLIKTNMPFTRLYIKDNLERLIQE